MVLVRRATRGSDIAAQLASVTQNAADIGLAVILSFIGSLCAFALAVTLYAITRDEDQEIALLGLVCRAGEGVVGGLTVLSKLALLLVAASAAGAAAYPLAQLLLRLGGYITLVSASFFAFGSTFFSYLLLRGRIVPRPLAALGVIGSLLIAFGLPAQAAGYLSRSVTDLMFIPVAGFEIIVALWLIIKGAAMPRVANPAGGYQLAGVND
jgi:hypothetical protein